MGKALGDPKNLWMLLAVPVVLFATILAYLGKLSIPAHDIVYARDMVPVPIIDTVFIACALFALLGFFAGVVRYWKDLKSGTK
jgi:hypothetical protein